MNVSRKLRIWLGWCPNAAMLNKNEEIDIVSYERKYIHKIKGMGFRGFLGILHLVFGVWLIITALLILARPQIFPWWILDINIISSGILLMIGLTSLLIFFNFLKSANVHRILALVNIALLVGFFLYLSQFLVSQEFVYTVFLDKLYTNYGFGLVSLILFTLILGVPSILTLFSKPVGEKKTRFFGATLLTIIIVFASLGAYYLYLNEQKDAMRIEESGKSDGYELYRIEPTAPWSWGGNPYYLDSPGDTTGHPISKDTYDAIQFLRNKEGSAKVLSWWDFELDIKAAGKEPVISYASEAIKPTIARPASLYNKYEPNEKVVDVSGFFTTDSEDTAKSIAEKYGASLVYMPKEKIRGIFSVIFMAANPGFDFQSLSGIQSPEDFEKRFYEPSMAHKFNSGAELKYFGKIFENKDVIIYQLK